MNNKVKDAFSLFANNATVLRQYVIVLLLWIWCREQDKYD